NVDLPQQFRSITPIRSPSDTVKEMFSKSGDTPYFLDRPCALMIGGITFEDTSLPDRFRCDCALPLRQAQRYKFGRAFSRPDRNDDILLALIHVAHCSASRSGRKLGFPKHRSRSLVVSTELLTATARRCANVERISFTYLAA